MSLDFRQAILEYLTREDINMINVCEMTSAHASKLCAFLDEKQDLLYAEYVPSEDLAERPFCIRVMTTDETQYLVIRGRTLVDTSSCSDATAELVERMSNLN